MTFAKNQRLHQMTAQIPVVSFWVSDSIFSQTSLFSIGGVHPSLEGNTLLHTTTANRILHILSTDTRGYLTEVDMAAAELSCTRAECCWQMEAKAQVKAPMTPLPHQQA